MSVFEDQIQAAKNADMLALIGSTVVLTPAATGREWEGACPECGGKNRLHVRRDGWFCRQCKPIDPVHGWHSPIDWLMWRERLAFGDAVEQLAGAQSFTTPVITRNNPAQSPAAGAAPSGDWQRHAANLCTEAAERLWSDAGKPGQDYLLSRGLEPHVWLQFKLGYATHWHPGAKSEIPAICIPWVYGRGIPAVRFRFIAPPDKTKLISLKGSRFGGVLFGGQALPSYVFEPLPENGRCAEGRSTLVLCEGEINAMSFWQVAHEQRVDVLSMGSESAKLTDKALAFARRYGLVIVWMDKGDLADALAQQLPGAARFHSPKGQDANDLLQAGRLGGLLAMMRWRAATTEDARMNVFWSVWDDAHGVQGIDTGTANAFRTLCSQAGRSFDLGEPEPGRWVTRRWLEAL